ncbi:MAG: peptidylprolyl isomerase [Bacteroidota bacterium]
MNEHLTTTSSRFISVILLFCWALTLGAQANPLIIEKIIAKVGTENIFYSEVQELYQYAVAQTGSADPAIQCDILEQLIARKLLIDQAKLDSIIVSEIEVEAEVQRRLDYILQQMGGDEERFYQYYNQSIADKREEMREPTREMMLEQRIQGTLISDVEITPKEVVAFFDKIPVDSLPFLSAEVEIAEISIPTRISEENMMKAREKIEEVRRRIVEDGESFQELASIFSDDPGSAARGGDLGWAKRGSYVPEFEATAFNLEQGEISEVIQTQFGYHFLELLERRGNNIHIRHILVKPEVTPEDVASTISYLDSIKAKIFQDTIPFEVAVKLYSDEETQSYSNAGRLINTQTGDTFWETSQLPHQIFFATEGIAVDSISEVIEMKDQRGERIFKLVQLQSRTKPHRASLETDFAKIKQYAKESKKNEYFNTWMDEKIASTYISIIPEFRGCPNLGSFLAGGN